MNEYEEMKKRHAEEIQSIPMIFLFGKKTEEELKEQLKSIEAESEEELCYIGAYGYIHKKNKDRFLEIVERQKKERQEKLRGAYYDYFYSMFATEMANQEYGYTLDLTDTLDACGVTAKDLEKNPVMRKALNKASKDCIAGN